MKIFTLASIIFPFFFNFLFLMTNTSNKYFEWIENEKEIGTPPYERAGHSAVIAQDKMFVYGGHDANNNKLNDLVIFDLKQHMFMGVVAMNRLVNLHKGKLQFRENCADKVPLSDSQELSPPPPPRAYHTAVLKDDFMIVYGGCPAEIEGPLYFLHLDTKTWLKYVNPNSPKEVKIPRSHHSAVMNGDEMIIYGGINGVTPLHTLLTFNTTKFKWNSYNQNNYPKIYKHSSFIRDGFLYLVGGTTDKANHNFTKIELKKYTVVSEGNEFPFTLNLSLLATFYDSSRDWLYIHGGYCVGDGDIECGCSDRLSIIDMKTPSNYVIISSPLVECPSPRCGHTMVLYDGKLIVFGGCDRLPLLNGEWVFCDFSNSINRFKPPPPDVQISQVRDYILSIQKS